MVKLSKIASSYVYELKITLKFAVRDFMVVFVHFLILHVGTKEQPTT